MLTPRRQSILKFIVEEYVASAVPVPSQSVVDKGDLGVSPATIRNEMAYLEHEGLLIRPHSSAGSIPSDRGYRYYVESLQNIGLAVAEKNLIDHLFHQVEDKSEAWLSLAATLLAQLTRNVAVVTLPKYSGSHFKHVELVAIQDFLALVVLVLEGAKVKQQLLVFSTPTTQPELTVLSNKLNSVYVGLNREQIITNKTELSPIEKSVSDSLVKMMQVEDEAGYLEPHMEGWHYMMNQPEFVNTSRVVALMELAENRMLLNAILPHGVPPRMQVVIGKENEAEVVQNYSIVISQYGLPQEAEGAIGVVGPTRMSYARNVSGVHYLASILTNLMAELHGKKISQSPRDPEPN